MKIAVGMSGGVDSSVAAYLLKEQGHDVIGLTMSIWDRDASVSHSGRNSCYGPDEKEDIAEAERICGILNIPFHVIDCSGKYKQTVIEYFRNEYLDARTPNPCVMCNHKIKFGSLLTEARASGIEFDKFATGHYARIDYDEEADRYLLKKGIDAKKDQSYFLYRLTQTQLRDSLFPLGELTKDEVREIARKVGLPVSEKGESQDFYSGDYRELLNVRDSDGEIVDTKGNVVGIHKGLWNYTPGQRRGIGISGSDPLYVVRLEKKTNRVVVGTKGEAEHTSFQVRDVDWIAIHSILRNITATVKTRSTHHGNEAVIDLINPFTVKVTLTDGAATVSPGQSAVFYDGDTVIGGGVIEEV